MPSSISIVIPTCDRINSLKRALNSLSNQSQPPHEIIVIDDGSKKPLTRSIFSGLSDSLKTTLLRNDVSRGANFSRNRGISKASGKWISFLDDDDEFMPNKIERLYQYIRKFENIDFFYHKALIQMVNENVNYVTEPKKFKADEDIFRKLLIKNYIGGTPMVTVKKEKLISVGGFKDDIKSQQDYELWLRLAKSKARFKFINEVLTKCNYTTKKKSISKSIESFQESTDYIENIYSDYYENLGDTKLKRHTEFKFDVKIHKAYLNYNYYQAIEFNFEAFLELKRIKYLIAMSLSFFGSSFIFKIRSLI